MMETSPHSLDDIGAHGLIYACGTLTKGEVVARDDLLGKRIHGIFGGRGQFLAIVDNWELDWPHSRDRSQALEQETVTLGLDKDVRIQQVSFGAQHRVIVSREGQLYSWGTRDAVLVNGELGHVAKTWHPVTLTPRTAEATLAQLTGTHESEFDEREVAMGRLATTICMPHRVHSPKDLFFTKVASGAHHSVAITDKGDLYAWGRNFEGQLGIGSTTLPAGVDRSRHGMCAWPKYVSALLNKPRVVEASCGDRFTVVLLENGSIWRFGERLGGTTVHPEEKMDAKPRLLITGGSDGSPFTSIASGFAHTLAVSASGEIFSWGLNTYGQLGRGRDDHSGRETPQPLGDQTPRVWSRIFAGAQYSAAVTSDGELFTWGNSQHGQLGHGSTAAEFVPRQVDALKGIQVSQVVCGQYNLYAFAPMLVTSISPQAGEVSGGYELRICGSGFWDSDDLTVRFAPLTEGRLPRGALARFDNVTREVVCQVPKFSLPGEFAVEVASDGKHFTANGLVFEAFRRPVVVGVSQWEARLSGGEEIVVSVEGPIPRSCTQPILAFIPDSTTNQRIQVAGTVVESNTVIPDSPREGAPSMVQLHFVTPGFAGADVVRCQLELSFNDGFMFAPVRLDPVPSSDGSTPRPERFVMTFHNAAVIQSRPNSFVTRSLPTPITWSVRHLLSDATSSSQLAVKLIVTELNVSEPDCECRVETILQITHVDQENGTITCTVPRLSEWVLSKKDAKTGDRVTITTDWWKFAPRWGFRASVAISMNGGRSILPTESTGACVFGVFALGKLVTAFPSAGPQSGGTQVAIASDFFHFDTDDAAVLLKWKDREVRVPARCFIPSDAVDSPRPSARRLVFTMPTLPYPAPPVVIPEDQASDELASPPEDPLPVTIDAVEEAAVFVSLDGNTFQHESSVPFTYYRSPELVEITPGETLPGGVLSLIVDGATPLPSGLPISACVRLTTAALGISTIVDVQVKEPGTTIDFVVPSLPIPEEDTVHVAFSLDGQQFTKTALDSVAPDNSPPSSRVLSFHYRTPSPPPTSEPV